MILSGIFQILDFRGIFPAWFLVAKGGRSLFQSGFRVIADLFVDRVRLFEERGCLSRHIFEFHFCKMSCAFVLFVILPLGYLCPYIDTRHLHVVGSYMRELQGRREEVWLDVDIAEFVSLEPVHPEGHLLIF